MITIFGATGNTGSIVAKALLDRSLALRIVARDPAKVSELARRGAEVVGGDVLDRESVRRALSGAAGAYLLMPPDPTSHDLLARNAAIAENFASAIEHHRTPHAVLLSSVAAQEPAGTGPIVAAHNAERALLAVNGDTRFTFVRAAYFMENLLMSAHAMKQDGVLPVFGGGADVPFPMVATADIGRVAAEALAAPPTANDVIELSGPDVYSFADAARTASRILGRDVKTVDVPLEAMVPTLTSFGISENVAALYREMTEGLAKGLVRYDGKGRTVRGTTPLEPVLRAGLSG